MLGLVVLLARTTAAGDAPPPISVEVNDVAGRVEVHVKATGAPVAVPACRGVAWESFDAKTNAYTPIAGEPCGPMAPAFWIDSDGMRFPLATAPTDAQMVRPVVVYGIGCRQNEPFEMAGCKDIGTVMGPNISAH